jgi:hypothetical protein
VKEWHIAVTTHSRSSWEVPRLIDGGLERLELKSLRISNRQRSSSAKGKVLAEPGYDQKIRGKKVISGARMRMRASREIPVFEIRNVFINI